MLLTYIGYPALLLASLALILFACELFTNGVEWTGKKLDLSDGAVGSILAAVGTALPETSIPIIALIAGKENSDIAVGAIAGAPFMLSTLTLFVAGAAYFWFSRRGKRGKGLNVDPKVLSRDLSFFLVVYTVAFITTFIPGHSIRLAIAAGLALSYGFYIYLTLSQEGVKGGHIEELHLSRVFRVQTHSGSILLQVVISLTLIVTGAHFFVVAVEHVSGMLGVPALLLSLIITPVATELPEKMNSVLWIREGKDTLAIGNITGAMVFQSSFPVAIGVAFTPWALNGPTMASALIAITSAAVCLVTLKLKKTLPPASLMLGGVFYAAFMAYLLTM